MQIQCKIITCTTPFPIPLSSIYARTNIKVHRSTIAVAESAPCAMFVASIISQASLPRPCEGGYCACC